MTSDQKQTIIGLMTICIIGISGFVFRGQIEAFLRSNHLLPEPEPLTELYFEDHINLPKTFVPGEKQSVRFTIHNIEYKTMKYRVDVTAKAGDTVTPIQSGDVLLTHDTSETLTQDFTLTEATRTAVMISLDTGQKIQLWVEPQKL